MSSQTDHGQNTVPALAFLVDINCPDRLSIFVGAKIHRQNGQSDIFTRGLPPIATQSWGFWSGKGLQRILINTTRHAVACTLQLLTSPKSLSREAINGDQWDKRFINFVKFLSDVHVHYDNTNDVFWGIHFPEKINGFMICVKQDLFPVFWR